MRGCAEHWQEVPLALGIIHPALEAPLWLSACLRKHLDPVFHDFRDTWPGHHVFHPSPYIGSLIIYEILTQDDSISAGVPL